MNRNHPNHQHQPPDPQHDKDPRHTQDLDTVAQKPTHVGLGAPVTAPDKDAYRDLDRPTPGAQPPSEHPDGPKADLREPEHVAAGMNALLQSTMFTLRQMGPMRGLKTWLKVNKKDGFDCQSEGAGASRPF